MIIHLFIVSSAVQMYEFLFIHFHDILTSAQKLEGLNGV